MRFWAFVLVFISSSAMASFPSPQTLALLGDKISEYRLKKNDKLRYKDVKIIEYLLYKGDHFRAQLVRENEFKKRFAIGLTLRANFLEKKLTYKLFNKFIINIFEHEQSIDFEVIKKGKKIENASITKGVVSEKYIKDLKKELYFLTLKSRGMSDFQIAENIALNIEHKDMVEDKKENFTIRIKEAFYNNHADNTNWEYLPVKLVSYPIQKILYDLPTIATSTVTESVTRSPLHNLQGTGDEFKGAGLGLWNGLRDIIKGIIRPKNATFFDGVLELGDASLRIVKGGLGVAKSAVSLVGYPLYRAFGGEKSKRVPLRGKRAAIVIIDTGTMLGAVDNIIDTYGETIIRGQLKTLGQYYCVGSNAEPNSIIDCINKIPSNIQYVDLFALTHTGGTESIEFYAKYAAQTRGVKPELMISIGCYDDPSDLTERENTVGQQKTSWAVHYYLSNLISKRLRGIPMEEAANSSFYEGMPVNIINPISLGAYGVISLMEGDIGLGYYGSKPDIYSPSEIVKSLIANSWGKVSAEIYNFQWDYILAKEVNDRKEVAKLSRAPLEETLKKIEKLHAYLDGREAKLPEKSLLLIAKSKRLLGFINEEMKKNHEIDSYHHLLSTLEKEKKLSHELGMDIHFFRMINLIARD